MKPKISIILGGAGFIGSQLIKYLLDENDKLFVIDNLCRGSKDFIKKNEKVIFEKINIDDFHEMYKCIEKINDKFEIN